MPFRPLPHSKLIIRDRSFTVCEHPAAPGMAYGQSGRRATVYQLRDGTGRYAALKVFNHTFRTVEIEQSAKNLQSWAKLPGLGVCSRLVLTEAADTALIQQFPDLRYAVLMPWVLGSTWQEVILTRIEFKLRESFQFANSLVNILAGMERSGLAHCDLSGANVLLPGLFNQQPPVALVDVEEMYLPEAETPAKLPAGTSGYNHQTSASGLWGSDADRFAGAVMIAEMLGWFDPAVRSAALSNQNDPGEQYFSASDMQKPGHRYDVLRESIASTWGADVAILFERAWSSATLADCPSFAEWQGAFASLPKRLAVLEEKAQSGEAASHPLKGWRKPGSSAPENQMVGGRYQVLELFNDGGFGTIYLATDLRDNSRCVLKKNKDLSEEGRRQFAREASLVRRLNHPNLVKVLDYLDLPNEGQFIVMEMIQGDDLQTFVTQPPVPFSKIQSYMGQICDALTYLHGQNPPIIHRDIKPHNIRVTASGCAVLMDFGIARTATPDVRTAIGARAISPGFSPPEQYGETSTDIRTDIYALGATVWSLLTGRSPQESIDRMNQDAMFPLNGIVPAHIEQALRSALDLDPTCRFASAREFWQALITAAPPISKPVPVKPAARRTPAWIYALTGVLLSLCFVALGIGAAGWWISSQSGDPAAVPPVPVQTTESPASTLSPTRRTSPTDPPQVTSTFSPTETYTSTSAPTLTATITPGVYQCADKGRLQLSLNKNGKVQKNGAKLLKEPGVSGDENVIRTLLARENIRVVGPPRCINNVTWWEIKTESSAIGWTPEVDPVMGRLLGLRNP